MHEERTTEWPIGAVATMSGTTNRTLRHYGEIGLLTPSRVGANGQRFYDRDGLVRLQRILLLRELGLGLSAVADVLDHEDDTAAALEAHLGWLEAERDRLDRQLASVTRTLHALRQGTELTVTEIFDGFDHTAHKDEVEHRWGADAYAAGNRWWESKSAADKDDFRAALAARTRAWIELAATDASPEAAAAQLLARAHVEWLRSIPGTPAADGDAAQLNAYILGLAQWYVDDERFASNYGGRDGAAFVKSALEHFAGANL
ncbi:MerR family transcriptional regulator [Gryllotalpicola reticulitermitis]|uniref:MerR family transcriptional regulator n=1 Tax=Gryllotalpicola reticulitermitis TaxID=1184153 RepID=A0ABV8Q5R5_9MICO